MTGTIICKSTPTGAEVKVWQQYHVGDILASGTTPFTFSADPTLEYTIDFYKSGHNRVRKENIAVGEGETLDVVVTLPDVTITLCSHRFYVYNACTNKPITDAIFGGFHPGGSVDQRVTPDSDNPGWYTDRWEAPINASLTMPVKAKGYVDTRIDYKQCEEDTRIWLWPGISYLDLWRPFPKDANGNEQCTQRFHVYDAYTRQPIEGAVISIGLPRWFEWDKYRSITTSEGNGWYSLSGLYKWTKWGLAPPPKPLCPPTTVRVVAPGYATPSVTFMHCDKDVEIAMMPGNSAKDAFEYMGAAAVFSGDVEGMLCRQRYFVFDAVTGKPIANASVSSAVAGGTGTPVSGEPGWYLGRPVPKWGPPPPPFVREFPRPSGEAVAVAEGYQKASTHHILCKKNEYIPMMPLCRTMDELPRTCPVAIPDVPYVDPGVFVPPPVIASGDVTLVPDEMTQLVCKSTPTDADVSIMEAVSGNVIATGKSPITYRVPVAHDYIVLFEKEGYTTNEVTVVK